MSQIVYVVYLVDRHLSDSEDVPSNSMFVARLRSPGEAENYKSRLMRQARPHEFFIVRQEVIPSPTDKTLKFYDIKTTVTKNSQRND